MNLYFSAIFFGYRATFRLSLGGYTHTGCLKKDGTASKINKKIISHPTRAKRTPSAAATVQVSHELTTVRFSCLLQGRFPRWRRSRKRLCVCFVLRCQDL